ncbi:hypothetical protein PORY_000457 [Pneumocystis oryctolagi]|uniref:Uncharacterized protein n=1 Tax=Pneumocystis oryctolagi TaxID=42067 RepID=A0ACB7CJI7_9ASCO|nr:hypothetical protein PORY_000457 [Pneumocystis oryctolagi]
MKKQSFFTAEKFKISKIISRNVLSVFFREKTTFISDFLSPTTSWKLDQILSPYLRNSPDISRFKQGNILPAGYNYLYFSKCEPEECLAKDGGDKLYVPSVNWNRRLWAKGSLEYTKKDTLWPLRMGYPAICIETAKKVDQECNKNSTVSVWIHKEIAPLDEKEKVREIFLRERTCMVYQLQEKTEKKVVQRQKKTWIPEFSLSITPSQVLLFRYSALTFNTHRIHYDYLYLKEEKYKNLLVQGSLSVVFLLELLRQHVSPKLSLKSFYYTIQRPLYADSTYKLCGRRLKKLSGIQYILWIESDDLLHVRGTAEMW